MANTNEQFDQHFREKLDGHREKPSALAWDRLEGQLPKESKSRGIWWAIAASVTALLVAGYSFWPADRQSSEEPLLAEKTEIPAEAAKTADNQESSEEPAIAQQAIQPEEKTATPKTDQKSAKEPKVIQQTKPTISPDKMGTLPNLIAQAEPEAKTITRPAIVVPDLKSEELPLAMPELTAPALEKTLAQNTADAEDEPLYRVSIYSSGIKQNEPVEKNLITELGKTVGQVEGLLSKVDVGFAELQDKKDNLFAGLTGKKDRAER